MATKKKPERQQIHVRGGLKSPAKDEVIVLAGKEKGKKGRVLRTIPSKGAVIVEGLNLIKRHTRPSQKNPQGGIVMREGPINASNVMVVCPQCGEPSRMRRERTEDGTLIRYCKKCNQPIDK